MTRQKAVIIVTIVALAFAGLASWGVYDYLQQEANKSKAIQSIPLIVAAGDIPIGTKLDPTQMKSSAIPRSSIPEGSFSDSKALIGRVVVRHLSPGDAITEHKLMPKDGAQMAGVMTYIIPKGHRAITVAVNEVAGVAGFVAPNNRVDVVLTTPIPNNTRGENISKIVLQNVTVLATGQVTEQKDGKPVVVPTVTLDLTPDDSEKLVLAASKGSLQLLLRNVVDTEPAAGKGATIAKVLSGMDSRVDTTPSDKKPKVAKTAKAVKATAASAAPVPAYKAPPQNKHYMEIIKGRERAVKEFVD